MITPKQEIYQKLSQNFTKIPIYTKFNEDYFTPIAIFEKLKKLKPTYLLESAGEHQEHGRYSYIGFAEENLELNLNTLKHLTHENQLKNTYVNNDLPPFYNGYIGYLSYESIQELYSIKDTKPGSIPHQQIFASKITIIIDHFINKITIVYNADIELDPYEKAYKKIFEIKSLIQEHNISSIYKPLKKCISIQSNMTKEAYISMVLKAKDYIAAGDIFQVVLSQQFSAPLEVEPFEIYKSVRRENPSPYLSYIAFNDMITICSSPELLVKQENGIVQTAPIAGTRAVKNDGKDHLRVQELLNDQKELSEHLMLVDLGRNDIGRISKPGSVTVDAFCQVKKYAKVMHLVSSVKGVLKSDETSLSALISTFPAGTVSGAPKIRAMEIINELEPDERNLYAGSIFYMNCNGNLNSCIAIRTITLANDTITMQSGGGIVYDSKPEDEYKETLNKAQALFNALDNLYEGGISYDFNHR